MQVRVSLNRRSLTDVRLFDAFGMVNECRKSVEKAKVPSVPVDLQERSSLTLSVDAFLKLSLGHLFRPFQSFSTCHRHCPLKYQGALRIHDQKTSKTGKRDRLFRPLGKTDTTSKSVRQSKLRLLRPTLKLHPSKQLYILTPDPNPILNSHAFDM